LANRLKAQGAKQSGILWAGPQDPGPLGGITQSGINDFMGCRERFRVKWIEGWRVADRFSRAMEYGTMFHLACEHHGQEQPWQPPVLEYAKGLCQKYPTDCEDIDKYYEALKVQFPVYVDYWSKHEATKPCKTHSREQSFNVPYKLPSGRTVYLRGKSDGLDEVQGGLRLLEHKTKSELDPVGIERRLSCDLQTCLYSIALSIQEKQPVIGVLYDVVRRPFSGGKGSIKRAEPKQLKSGFKEGESKEDFNNRLKQYFVDEPETWFARWELTFGLKDLCNFRHKCLDPLLESLCDWYEFISLHPDPFDPAGHGIHWVAPFGLYSSLVDGSGTTDLDAYLLEGSSVGLERATTLFRELA
jgi:hypothetical protein